MTELRPKTARIPRLMLASAMFFSTAIAAMAQSLNATSITFGNVALQTASPAKVVILSNTQTIPITINSISTSGDFTETSNCPIGPKTLAAGVTCQIKVTFTPTVLATETGSLVVNDNASNSSQTAQLSGVGVPPVTVTPANWNVGNQAVNTMGAPHDVGVTNYLTVPVTIGSISVTGQFATITNCQLSPNTLAARTTCTISVTFAPTAVGTTTGTLTVSDTAANSPQTMQLTGTGVAPVALTPATFGFANQFVNTTSTARAFILTNNQSVPLSITNISISGVFSQTSNCPTAPSTLAPNTSCTISVLFTPTVAGTAAGVLTVIDSASTSPQTVSLKGSGVLPVSVTPANLVFPATHPTIASAPQTITVKNNQPGALTISGISISGDYTQTSSTCLLSPNTLAAGSSCTVSVTFTPTALGTRTGTLAINDDANTNPQVAGLTGTGTLLGLNQISVTPSSAAMFTGSQKQFTATGTFANGSVINATNFLNWSSSVSGYAQVNSTGLVQGLAAGESIIVASYGKVSGEANVKVSVPAVTSITLTPANSSQPVGAYQQFTAVLHFSNGSTTDSTSAVSWSSSSNTVATVGPSGLASASSPGSTTVKAALGSVMSGTTLKVTQPLCTAAPTGLLAFWPGDGNVVDIAGTNSGMRQSNAGYGIGEVGQAFTMVGNGPAVFVNSPIYSPKAGTLIFWFKSTGGGTLTGGYAGGQNRAPGFLIDSSGNLNWEFGNLDAQPLGQVSPNRWYLAALAYSTNNSETTVNVYLNGVLVDSAIADANTSWNPQVAFGAYLGAQQPPFAGAMDEIAIFDQPLNSQQIGQIYGAYSAGICKPMLQTIAVTPANPSLASGLSMPLDALGSYSDGSTHDLTTSTNWSTDNSSVASINANGLATALASGSTTVSAALGSIQGSTTLAVKPSLVSIQVNPPLPLTSVGAVQSFTAIGTFNDGSTQNLTTSVTWSTSSLAVATIGSNGVAMGVGSGQTTITATAGAVSGSSVLTVTFATLSSIAVSPANPTIVAGTNQQFTAMGIMSDGSQQNLTASVAWNSSSSAIGTIAPSGLATAVGAGQTTITATLGSISGSANLTVTTAVLIAIQVSPHVSSAIIGGSQQFGTTAIYSDGTSANISASANWASSAPTVATMSNTSPGLAVSAGTGTTTISSSFGGLVDSTTFSVQDQLVSISVMPSGVSVTTGQTEQLSAIGTYASGVTQNLTQSVTWSSSVPAIAGVSPSGLATALTPGQTSINAAVGNVTGSASFTVGSPSVVGQWNTLPTTMPINPIHVALLSNGELLVIAGSGNCAPSLAGCPSGPPYGPSNRSGALLLNPFTGQVSAQFSVSWDMFCNGMVLLQNGTALIVGGNLQYNPFEGEPQASIFDPSTNTFTNIQNMAHGRWYPTELTLADGTVMTFSGLSETGGTNTSVEFYEQGSGWSTPYSAPFTPDLYPRLHLLPNGKVLYSGANPTTRLFDPSTITWNTNLASTNYGGVRLYGSSVLLPLTPANGYDPKVIIMGGGNPATNTTEIIDMGAATPAWQYGPNMSQARIEMNAVILPNGAVLALGGSVNNEDVTTASLNADLYNPATNTVSSAGANVFPRLYHSVALLLPDATAWVAGGNPTQGSYEHHVEIYQPAYLFNPDGTMATRPSITSAPSSISYGSVFSIPTPDAANISSMVLVRNGTVTHAFGMDQREVGLSFTAGNGLLTVTAPPNGNIAPPGYYMLFILNSSGVPSVAAFVQMTTSQTSAAPSQSTPFSLETSAQLLSNTFSPDKMPTRSNDIQENTIPDALNLVEDQTERTDSAKKTANDLSATWAGKFVSKHAENGSFTMKVVIRKDSSGRLVGTSTLNSNCLKHVRLQVTVTGSQVVLAGSDEAEDNITVRGTVDKSGTVLNSSYILDGSATGKCETDAGTGILTKQ